MTIDRTSNRSRWEGTRLYTIGHSTRPTAELIGLLRAAGVDLLADIRTVTRSRRNPQFNADALRASLAGHGIRYEHIAKLGGLRRTRKDSTNTGWRNASFRGYADYMETADFESGLQELRRLTAQGTVALMCAEIVPWRCHRSLVSDVLTVRGADVRHIIGSAAPGPHRLTAFARVAGDGVTYPAGDDVAGIALATSAPFHLEATVRVLQRRPSNATDVWEDGRWLHAFAATGGPVLTAVENRGSIDAPDVCLSILKGAVSADERRRLERTVRTMLGLDVDPEPLRAAAERLPRLRPVAGALRGMRPPRFAGLFDTILNVVPFQQLSLDAGTAIVGRLAGRFGKEVSLDKRRFTALPTAGAIAGARLPALLKCGLSRAKAESLRSLAKTIDSGELSDRMIEPLGTPDALKTLVKLPGIGPWSAALLLLRGFGRLEVFPPGDSGATRGLNELLDLRTPSALGRVVERFGDRRGYLYFCGLGASLLSRGLVHAAPESSAGPTSK